MNIRTLDLNLLRTFDVLMKERSVTAAAERLGLTQPSLSNALNRLRAAFGDPLFVRTTSGMQPTAMASRIARPVADALASLQSAFASNADFDPARSLRTFTLLTTDTGELIVLPRLASRLKSAAPGVRVVVRHMPREAYRSALESGEADLAIGQLPPTHKDFMQQFLFEETYVCLADTRHHDLRRGISLEKFLSAEHLAIGAPSMGERLVARALGRNASRRRIMLEAPNYLVAPEIVRASGLIAVVPRTISLAFPNFRTLRALPLPFRLAPVRVRQFWHRRANQDPGIRWLRGIVAEVHAAATAERRQTRRIDAQSTN